MEAKPKNAYQLFNEELSAPKTFTGFADLDLLLCGGIRTGLFYLFYGDEESGVDVLIHRILANSLLPPDKNGFGGKTIYVNCGNYKYEKTLLDIELLGGLLKSAGLDPFEAMDRIYVICAFSEEQEEEIIGEVNSLVEKDPEIRMVVIHNIAKLFTDPKHTPNKNLMRKIPSLEKVVGKLFQTCLAHNLALVASCRPNKTPKGKVPLPEGGKYLRHKANVIVYLRRVGKTPQVQAFLLKHPRKERKNLVFQFNGGDFMGRITIPFRTRLQEQLNELKRTFQPALIDQNRQKALESLMKAWTSEQGAMSYCNVPTVLDVMLLTGVVDNKKMILELNEKISRIEGKLSKALAYLQMVKLPNIAGIPQLE